MLTPFLLVFLHLQHFMYMRCLHCVLVDLNIIFENCPITDTFERHGTDIINFTMTNIVKFDYYIITFEAENF